MKISPSFDIFLFTYFVIKKVIIQKSKLTLNNKFNACVTNLSTRTIISIYGKKYYINGCLNTICLKKINNHLSLEI